MNVFSIEPDYYAPPMTWVNLLAISTRFSFTKLRATSLAALSALRQDPVCSLSPVIFLQLGLEHNIPSWFKSACIEIVETRTPLEIEDISHLPVHIVLLLSRARELFHHRDNWVPDSSSLIYTPVLPQRSVDKIIDDQMERLGVNITG